MWTPEVQDTEPHIVGLQTTAGLFGPIDAEIINSWYKSAGCVYTRYRTAAKVVEKSQQGKIAIDSAKKVLHIYGCFNSRVMRDADQVVLILTREIEERTNHTDTYSGSNFEISQELDALETALLRVNTRVNIAAQRNEALKNLSAKLEDCIK